MLEVLLLTDSRGFAIKEQLNSLMNDDTFINIQLAALSGGTVSEVTQYGLASVQDSKFHQVYLMAGINDLTCKLGVREVTPVFNNWSLLVRHMMIQYYEARDLLSNLASDVVVCEFTGIHFGLYNASGKAYSPQQDILNNGVIRVNEYIAEMNREAKVFSPYIAGLTHKMKETDKLYHRYALTTHDGLHYNNMTAYKHAENLLQNVRDLYLDNHGQS